MIINLDEAGDCPPELVGGKAAQLAALRRAGLPAPPGFCVTSAAFDRYRAACPGLAALLAELGDTAPDDRDALARLGVTVRRKLARVAMPTEVRAEIVAAWRAAGSGHAFAVRSSAAAEDSADASFAGQYDTYLNVRGADAIVDAVERCWQSVFTERAISYRRQHGFDETGVAFAVVVQRMVHPDVAGVMFTADPVSGHRRTVVINAAYGLGESVVSGLVNPDLYRVGPDGVIHTSLGDKRWRIVAGPDLGVIRETVGSDQRQVPALPDSLIAELARYGRRIEDHFGCPQDVEWAVTDGEITILQARPITSLYPVPPAPSDGQLHVYFSFGHQQMMTDAIKPLGLSVLRTFFPLGGREQDHESTQLVAAGNRLFFDYTDPLHSRLGLRFLSRAAGSMDERVGRALVELAHRPDFATATARNARRQRRIDRYVLMLLARIAADLCWADMSRRHARVTQFSDRVVATSRARVESLHGAARIEAIQQELMTWPLQMFLRLTLPQVSALRARGLVAKLTHRWLGPDVSLAALDKSLPGNVTTEMAFAIADLADLAKDHPEVLAVLKAPPQLCPLSVFDAVDGGPQFRAALESFLRRYGIRGPGEVDLTRPRWDEQPEQLFASIVANCRPGPAGEHRARFARAESEARQAIDELLGRLRATRLGPAKTLVLRRLITVHRTLMGLREHQKFLSVRLFDIYRRALRAEAATLVQAGVLQIIDDIDYLGLDEIRLALAGTPPADLAETIAQRKSAYDASTRLSPPRLFTSDGEIVPGAHDAQHRDGVLVGCPVSAGVAQGRARVVLRPDEAELADGDIMIAPFTDPAWTPLFSAVRGIVLEIGGVMTHGAVVARELGIPTVVGIDGATRLITDGAMIRVDGSAGYVETVGAQPEAAA